ncbi:MAG: hypothetical protein ACLTEH_02930 [Clostridia bacterium]
MITLLVQDAKNYFVKRIYYSKSEPVFGGVYKLAAIEENNCITPKIKISETLIKITNPGFKRTYRFYDKTTHKALADVITLAEEKIPEDNYLIFDEQNPWKKKHLTNYEVVPLQQKIFENGQLLYFSFFIGIYLCQSTIR